MFTTLIVDEPDHHFDRRSSIRHRKIRARLTKDLIRLTQLAVLPLQRLHLLGHIGRNARALAAVDLGLLDPLVQGLGRATDLRGNRQDRLPARSMLPLSRTSCLRGGGWPSRASWCCQL